ncbi:MAG TPA: hypothetical protein VLF60_04410 [Candidatus Saccharimonadales bacterium]|nr:hypothetical protein [Candidatus Saccharimonadales bacterium]
MKRFSRLGGLLVSLLFLAAAGGAVFFRQDILDWWALRSYTPPAEVQQLADQGTVTKYARRIFYASHPAVEDSAPFNQHCNQHAEKTIVLGCYDGRYIYVYNVTDQRLNGVKQVTAMHEMLHAIYQRLSPSERTKVDSEVEAQFKSMNDAHINELVAEYQKSEPGEVDNELHSILGTEVGGLSPDLETYYTKYFTNRQAVVSFANQYESAFTDSQKKIATIDAQLASLQSQIDQNQKTLAAQQTVLDAESARMSSLRSSGSVDTYNAAVAPYNAKVQAYNGLIADTKQLVAQYNSLVETRNALATAHNNLAQSLNSSLQALPAQ